jgi:cytoskeleton protein RodZ
VTYYNRLSVFEIGNSLREARLRHDLDFPQIEQATKIRGKYLRALEEEQFEVLPAETYVKGFLRSYAEYLGLDGQLYVDEFNSRYVRGEEEREPPFHPRRSSGYSGGGGRMATSAMVVVLALIAGATALVFVAWRFGADDPPQVPLPPNRISPQPATPTAQKPVARLVTTAAQSGNAFLAVFRGSRTGKPIYQGTLERGQSLRFQGTRLWVYVYAPANLRLRLNGRAIAVPGRGQGPKRWLRVTPRRITVAPSPA